MVRPEEDLSAYNKLDELVSEYIDLDINKLFGMTLTEWLESTSYIKSRLRIKSEQRMAELSIELEEIKNQNDALLKENEETVDGTR